MYVSDAVYYDYADGPRRTPRNVRYLILSTIDNTFYSIFPFRTFRRIISN